MPGTARHVEWPKSLRASVRRHRSAQRHPWLLQSITPKWAALNKKGLVGFRSHASQQNQDSEPLQSAQGGERELRPSFCFRTHSAVSDRARIHASHHDVGWTSGRSPRGMISARPLQPSPAHRAAAGRPRFSPCHYGRPIEVVYPRGRTPHHTLSSSLADSSTSFSAARTVIEGTPRDHISVLLLASRCKPPVGLTPREPLH
jgi:hypothetical protein